MVAEEIASVIAVETATGNCSGRAGQDSRSRPGHWRARL
jgi:hypothetical protein